MSRVIVKNLPLKVSLQDFKKHFNTKGNVTDAKLQYVNGEFRRYGFIGYESEDAATEACSFFNGTYFKQDKMTVEICTAYKKEDKPMSWRERNKQRKETEKQKKMEIQEELKNKKKKGKKKKSLDKQVLEEHKTSPEFEEFMKLKEKGATHAEEGMDKNEPDDEGIFVNETDEPEEKEEVEQKVADKSISDLDYLKMLKSSSSSNEAPKEEAKKKAPKEKKELYTVVIRTKQMCKVGKKVLTKQNIKAFLKPTKFQSLRIPSKMKLVAYVGFKTEKQMKQALGKNKSFIDGARVTVMKYEKNVPSEENKKANMPWQNTEEKVKQSEPVTETGSIYVRNLWYSVAEDDLRTLFGEYGQIVDINLPICKYTRRPKGFAIVKFMFPEHALRAMAELDGSTFKGRILHILPAIANEERENNVDESNYKEKKKQEQKATAGSWHNWNTLFIGSDAVVEIMAEKYHRSKQEILNDEGKQSVAVNLALGETQIVYETRKFLEDNGISIEAFTKVGIQRSNTVILIKNLPANTTAQELAELFGRYGELGRVVLPPSGVTAVVEYLDPSEAKKGFKNLAYSKFKYLPLYLEWAPVDVFKTKYIPTQENKLSSEGTEGEVKSENNPEGEPEEKEEEEEEDPEPDTTVFVKNLSKETTEIRLKEHFERIGRIYTCLIAKRTGVSQGYGFVQFMYRSDAQKAIKTMCESELDGQTVQIKLSEKTLVTKPKSSRMIHKAGKQKSSKILVKNVPFQATPKEVRQLFATFGEIKSVRLPSKMNSQEHRGFGFVEYVTREDAKKAFEALSLSTHLYGRRLVLEWAKEDETVEEIRKRTAAKFLSSGPSRKRTRVEVGPATTEFDDE